MCVSGCASKQAPVCDAAGTVYVWGCLVWVSLCVCVCVSIASGAVSLEGICQLRMLLSAPVARGCRGAWLHAPFLLVAKIALRDTYVGASFQANTCIYVACVSGGCAVLPQ